jgi:hypothetical protein
MSKKYVERKNFSIVRIDGNFRIQCDDTLELVSGKIRSLAKANQILKNHVNTDKFLIESKDFTKEEIVRRVRLFGGRLRPKGKLWTIEEARLVASLYTSRGEFFNKNKRLYSTAYANNWLDDICKGMKPSRKKNKFVFGVLNPNKALARIFDYDNFADFVKNQMGAVGVLRRFGVNASELFENRDSAEYLKNVIRTLADDVVENFVK